jgi:hypothetical protein
MRTVDAVTAPLLAIAPRAFTQAPTARADEVTACVSLSVVDLDAVILSFCVFGAGGFFDLDDFEELELDDFDDDVAL